LSPLVLAIGVVIKKPAPLLLPICRQRPLELLQHWRLIRPPFKNRFDDVRRQQRQPQDPADRALVDSLGVADLADGGVDAFIQHPLPSPRTRQRLDQRPVGCGFDAGTIAPPSGDTIPLSAAAALGESVRTQT
jgi:hypothetical protein